MLNKEIKQTIINLITYNPFYTEKGILFYLTKVLKYKIDVDVEFEIINFIKKIKKHIVN